MPTTAHNHPSVGSSEDADGHEPSGVHPAEPAQSRVLFVDDEPMILRSIQRLLAGTKHSVFTFVDNAEAALRELDRCPADVIVTDMHMDGMNGAELLTLVQQRWPDTVRIVLSGQTESTLVYRAVPVAHRFLSKPFQSDVLVSTLERALELRELLANSAMRRIVGASNQLPSAPTAYTRLVEVLRRPDASISEVATAIESDAAMCAKLMQIACSAFFGLPRDVRSVRGAVIFLGVEAIKALVLSIEIFALFDGADSQLAIDAFQRESLLTGKLAQRIAPDRARADTAFLAGVLHDVGRLVVASRTPELARRIQERVNAERVPALEIEKAVLGATHAQVGAYLLGLWGLPQDVVAAVLDHHPSANRSLVAFDAVLAVQASNLIVREVLGGPDAPGELEMEMVFERLDTLGLLDRVPEWRAEAVRLATLA
jgi:HD-like signal output (HDOD) protein/CheY-like chemotaxis protein